MTRLLTLGFALVLLPSASAWAQDLAEFPPGTSVTMTDSASGVLKQCTRRTPTAIEGFWNPSDSVVGALEAPLIGLLRDVLPRLRLHGRPLATPKATDYYRQYIGVIRGGKRMVYVNGFAAELLDSQLADDLDSKQRPIVACDGGAWFFGVLYDVDGHAFERVEFNDDVGGAVRY